MPSQRRAFLRGGFPGEPDSRPPHHPPHHPPHYPPRAEVAEDEGANSADARSSGSGRAGTGGFRGMTATRGIRVEWPADLRPSAQCAREDDAMQSRASRQFAVREPFDGFGPKPSTVIVRRMRSNSVRDSTSVSGAGGHSMTRGEAFRTAQPLQSELRRVRRRRRGVRSG